MDEDDEADVTVRNGAIVIPQRRGTYSLAELVSKVRPKNRHAETDWVRPAGREAW